MTTSSGTTDLGKLLKQKLEHSAAAPDVPKFQSYEMRGMRINWYDVRNDEYKDKLFFSLVECMDYMREQFTEQGSQLATQQGIEMETFCCSVWADDPGYVDYTAGGWVDQIYVVIYTDSYNNTIRKYFLTKWSLTNFLKNLSDSAPTINTVQPYGRIDGSNLKYLGV